MTESTASYARLLLELAPSLDRMVTEAGERDPQILVGFDRFTDLCRAAVELESLRDKQDQPPVYARGGMVGPDAYSPWAYENRPPAVVKMAAELDARITQYNHAATNDVKLQAGDVRAMARLIHRQERELAGYATRAAVAEAAVTVIDTRDTGREEHALARLSIALDELLVTSVIRDAQGLVFEKRFTTGDFHWGRIRSVELVDERGMSQPITVLYTPTPTTEGATS